MTLYFSIMFETGSSVSSKGVNKPLYPWIFKFTTILAKKDLKLL